MSDKPFQLGGDQEPVLKDLARCLTKVDDGVGTLMESTIPGI